MRSTGKARTGVVGRRSLRRVAAFAVVGVLAAAGCSRSGDDRIPEGGRYRPALVNQVPTPPAASPSDAPSSPSASSSESPSESSSPSPSPSATESGSGSPSAAPEGEAFFDAPDPLPGDKPGGLVRERPAAADKAVAGGDKEQLVMYRTTGPDGQPVAATGTVTLPAGPAPEGGWPVVAWDHATTGIGAKCAPSRSGPGPSGQGSAEMLAEFVKRGYAVVQPDYVGMGVNGVKHPFLNGKSAAYATLDLVRAAREMDADVGKTLFVAGHSQGGHAALWSAHYAAEYAPDLELKGAVAVAPANDFAFLPYLVSQGGDPSTAMALMLLNGAAAADPSVVPADYLTDAGLAAAEKAWETCVGDQAEQLPSGTELFRPDANMLPLNGALIPQLPQATKPAVPVFIAQGGQDPLAKANLPLARDMCGAGVTLQYKTYADLPHDVTEVSTAAPDIVEWVEARKAGTAVEGACTLPSE